MIGRTYGSMYFLAAKVEEREKFGIINYYTYCRSVLFVEDLLRPGNNLFCSQQPKITFTFHMSS